MLGFDRLDDPIAFVAGNDCDIPEDIQHLLLSTRRALLLLDDHSQRATRQEMRVCFRQDAMGIVVLGHNHDAGRILVQPVDDAGAFDAADAGQ